MFDFGKTMGCNDKGGQLGDVVRLVSLEGLGLEAVLDRHGGCKFWELDDFIRPMLQASWCSMKLSTLHVES